MSIPLNGSIYEALGGAPEEEEDGDEEEEEVVWLWWLWLWLLPLLVVVWVWVVEEVLRSLGCGLLVEPPFMPPAIDVPTPTPPAPTPPSPAPPLMLELLPKPLPLPLVWTSTLDEWRPRVAPDALARTRPEVRG